MGLGSKIASTTPSSLDIGTSSSLVSQGNVSSNYAEAGGCSGIMTSTASDGGGVLGIETGVAGSEGCSVGTSKLDDESERGWRGLH